MYRTTASDFYKPAFEGPRASIAEKNPLDTITFEASVNSSVTQQTEIKQNGFTLIEILVTVVILAIIALSLLALFPTGYRQVTQAGRRSVMSHLAYEKMDKLKALGYGNSDLLAGIHPSTAAEYRLSDPNFDGYSLRWIVKDKDPMYDVKTVVVEVGYLLYEKDGTPISARKQQFQLRETFVTYIAQE